MSYSRFAIYYAPPDESLADFGASWLGWDLVRGCKVAQPSVHGLDDITMTPRKYGFHGTLKPPFQLNDGLDARGLDRAAGELAASLAPATCDGLTLTTLGRFLALTPFGDMAALSRVAERCVRDLDVFRKPSSADDLAKRRKAGLSARQDALLTQWGYPYVMEEFRFHLTLSGRLPEAAIGAWAKTVQSHLPDLPVPFCLDQIALCGERADGRFELIQRYALTG